jgi:hypothetical protein
MATFTKIVNTKTYLLKINIILCPFSMLMEWLKLKIIGLIIKRFFQKEKIQIHHLDNAWGWVKTKKLM